MTEPNMNWPKKGDVAFKSSFSSADQARLDAFIIPSEGSYLYGFQRAADMIVDAAVNDDRNPNALFCPVAYLYRHHLELFLKEIVRLGIRIGSLDECKEILGGHNLHKLWNKTKQLIIEVWPDSPDDDLKAVEKVILEFHNFDQTGQTFRYAHDKNGNPHLQSGPNRVDLGNLKTTMDAVSRFLDAAYAGIENCNSGYFDKEAKDDLV